jgi:uncharacterized protein (TIGR02246 family)
MTGTIPDQASQDAATFAISAIPLRMSDAWGTGDAHAFAAPFSGTADFVAFEGTHLTGRGEIEAFHQPLFGGALKGSRLTAQVEWVRLISADCAVMHATARTIMAGETAPLPSRDCMQLFVVTRTAAGWQAEAMLNARTLTLERQYFLDAIDTLAPEQHGQVNSLVTELSGSHP